MKNILSIDQIFQPYGAILHDPNPQDAFYLQTFDKILESYQKGPRFLKPINPVNVKFINNYQYNSVSILSDNFNYVGIYGGYKFILTDLFNRILSHRQTFSEIQDPRKELFDEPLLREYGSLNYKDYESLVPVSQLRQTFAHELLFLSLLFTFEHELAHYFHGHLEFGERNHKKNTFLELNESGANNIPPIISQTLEYDADAMAIASCIGLVFQICASNGFDPQISFFYSDPYEAIKYLLFAIYTSFLAMGDFEYNEKTKFEKTHPPARLRQLMLFATVTEVIKKRIPTLADKAEDCWFDAFEMGNEYYYLLTGKKKTKKIYDGNDPLISAIMDKWKEIRPELINYSFTELAG